MSTIVLFFGLVILLNQSMNVSLLSATIVPNNEIEHHTAKADDFLSPTNELYTNYFASITSESVNLTRAFQEEIGLWQLGQISNLSTVNITNDYLKNFTYQLDQFNLTESPDAFKNAKKNLTNSFANEIKSYEFFRDYLLTGNDTKNDISTDYLSQALELESIAFNEFKNALNNNTINNVPINYNIKNPDLNMTSISGFWSGDSYNIVGEIYNKGQLSYRSPQDIVFH